MHRWDFLQQWSIWEFAYSSDLDTQKKLVVGWLVLVLLLFLPKHHLFSMEERVALALRPPTSVVCSLPMLIHFSPACHLHGLWSRMCEHPNQSWYQSCDQFQRLDDSLCTIAKAVLNKKTKNLFYGFQPVNSNSWTERTQLSSPTPQAFLGGCNLHSVKERIAECQWSENWRNKERVELPCTPGEMLACIKCCGVWAILCHGWCTLWVGNFV